MSTDPVESLLGSRNGYFQPSPREHHLDRMKRSIQGPSVGSEIAPHRAAASGALALSPSQGSPKASEAAQVPAPGSSILTPLLWALEMGVEDALKPDRLGLLTRPH